MKKLSLEQILKLDRYYTNFIVDIAMCFTWPTVQIFMIQSISEQFYKEILLMEGIMGIMMYWLLTHTSILEKARQYFWFIVGIGTTMILFTNIILFMYLQSIEFRFIFMSITQALFCCLWMNVMTDSYNHVFVKSKLTKRLNGNTMWNRLGKLIGGGLAVLTSVSVEMAITIQCIVYVIMAIFEGYSVQRFKEMDIWKEEE